MQTRTACEDKAANAAGQERKGSGQPCGVSRLYIPENQRVSRTASGGNQCVRCGRTLAAEGRICPACGQIRTDRHPALKTQQGQERFSRDLAQLSRILQENTAGNRGPAEKSFYFDRINQLESIARNIGLPAEELGRIGKQCDKMRLYLKKQHIEIAIAGSVKAGKSSLINALLDEQIAAVETTPETSVLTKYRTTRTGNYIRVQFYNAAAWKNVWEDAGKSQTYRRDYQEANAERVREKWVNARPYHRNQLTMEQLKAEVRRFTYSKSADHFFVREVEVGICSQVFPTDVFLVDTPGLDDVVKARSAVTRRYLNKADAVLACVKADSIHESSEAQFINRVMSNRRDKNTLFVVVTKKDQKSAADFDQDYRYFLRNVLDEMFNPDENAARQIHAADNCFGISALVYNEMRSMENGTLRTAGELRYRQFLFMLFQMGYLDMGAMMNPEALDTSLRRCAAAVRRDSGIPHLKERLSRQFISAVRTANQQKTAEEFSRFRQNMNTLLADRIETLREQLRPLDADQEELALMRRQLQDAQRMRLELQAAIASAKKGGGL